MDQNELKISDEMLQNTSIENLVDLKVEVDDLINELNGIIKECNQTINS